MSRRSIRAGERGMTLIETMVTLAVMSFLMVGTLMFVITQAKMNVATFDKSDIQRGGRAAMSIMEDKLSIAGVGLPRHLAIKSFNPAADCTVPEPMLEVASIDFLREWTLSGTNGGTVTLSAADPFPPKPDTSSNDMAIPANRWMFLYQNTAPDGLGMVSVGALRALGGTTITVGTTNYNAAQTTLDLTAGAPIDAAPGRPSAMLLVSLSAFGVDCTDSAHPYLYWDNNLSTDRSPIARNVDIRALTAANNSIDAASSDVVALRFRFLLDSDSDGLPDDLDSSGSLDIGDFADTLTFGDPANSATTHDDVLAIEVLVRIRSDIASPQTGEYRTSDFMRVVGVPNIHTRTTGYIFVDNAGI